MKLFRLTSLVAVLLFAFGALAREFDKIPEAQVEEHFVHTEDGATEKLYHLSNPGKPILVMMPGLGAQAMSLEMPAQRAHAEGYDVWVCNWRGSALLPEQMGDGLAPGRNGLDEILEYDLPAHVRYVYEHATSEQRKELLRLFGHSMGGMMINKMGSNDKLAKEFNPLTKSRTLLQSPLDLKDVSPTMWAAAHIALPLLRTLRQNGVKAINLHSRLLKHSKKTKDAGGIKGKVIAPAVENFAILLTKLVLSPAHTGRKGVRRMFFKMAAESIPIDLLEDFAKAIVENKGEFLDKEGKPHLSPEKLGSIPTQIVRTRLDSLAPWKKALEYFQRIPGKLKQILDVYELNHTDSVLFESEEVDFLPKVFDFLKTPFEAVRVPMREYKPYCEGLLSHFKMKIRHKFRLRGL